MIVFFITGILANIFSVNFYSSSLGASGAIFGVIGALIVVKPLLVVWAFGLPMAIFVAGILWGIGDLTGAVRFLSGNPLDNTGNIAHLLGMFFGLFFGLFLKSKRGNWKSRRDLEQQKRRRVNIPESELRSWERAYLE